MEELEFELGVEVGLQKLSSCFTATISIAGASYCIFIAKNNQLRNLGRKVKKFFFKTTAGISFSPFLPSILQGLRGYHHRQA
jgi:hypothetical protein